MESVAECLESTRLFANSLTAILYLSQSSEVGGSSLLEDLADSDKLSVLKKVVRELKAWSEVISETDQLNLNALQRKDAYTCLGMKNLPDKFIWRERNAVQLSQLWEYFATHYYLPRLLDLNVRLNTVSKGVLLFDLEDDSAPSF